MSISLIGGLVSFKMQTLLIRYLGTRHAIRRKSIYSVTLGFIERRFMRFITMKAFGENFHGYKLGRV